jgi:hypothetical protein
MLNSTAPQKQRTASIIVSGQNRRMSDRKMRNAIFLSDILLLDFTLTILDRVQRLSQFY